MSQCCQINRMNPLISNTSMFLLENIELVKFESHMLGKKETLNFHTLWIMSSGKGLVKMNSAEYDLSDDKKVIFTNPGTMVEFFPRSHYHLHLYRLQFRVFQKEVERDEIVFKEKKDSILENDVHELDSSLKLKNVAKELLSRFECDLGANTFIVQKLFSEIMALVSNVFTNCKDGDKCSIIDCAISYMEEHYHEDITREQLACMVGLSKEYFSRLFKKETGQNFTEYLTNIRIQKAEEFLITSTAGLREIAENVGYKSEYYLSRKFKEVKGVSPTVFKETTQAAEAAIR